jgi:uncharacterized glyoxalase superfamily protein PhnB
MRLAQIRLITVDVPRLAAFYGAIARSVAIGSDVYAEIEMGPAGRAIAISNRAALEAHGAFDTTITGRHSFIIDLEVRDIEAARKHLEPVADHMILEPTTQPWGNRAMMFRDPDGNLVSMFSKLVHHG